jgi:hypothetical protein
MLTFRAGDPWDWRDQMLVACKVYHRGNLDNFAFAADGWAKENKVNVTEDALIDYRASLAGKGLPRVSYHFRRFTAHLLGLKLEEGIDPPPKMQDIPPAHLAFMATANGRSRFHRPPLFRRR